MQPTHQSDLQFYQLILIIFQAIPFLQSSENNCRIKEHASINSIVCSLNNLPMGGKQNLYLFSSKNIFKINSLTQLMVVNNIDRESLDIATCVPGPEDSIPPYCRITVDLINKSKPPDFHLTQINVDIEDINDNYPLFDKLTYNINIDENVPSGHMEQLPVARDMDYGINGEMVYSLEGKDKMFFDLMQLTKNKPMIKTMRMFDRETKEKYELILIVADKGSPKRTSEAKLLIKIRDLNDNVPEFNFQKNTVIGVKEDLIEGSKIGDIRVTDKDSDSLVNVYLDTNADSEVKKHFQASGTTGLTLIYRLNYESSLKKFTIPLIAVDNGIPSLTASATLIVNVLDVNDNTPSITIDSLSDISSNFKVAENKPKETFVAMVTVQDEDSGINGVVECIIVEQTSKRNFELFAKSYNNNPNQKRNYKIVTLQEFDREKITHYQVTVQCKDQGQPSLSSQQTITVWVEDENDNPPFFTRQHYQGKTKENALPGTKLFVLHATDPDVGTNAHIIYRIHPKYLDLVTINSPATGVVSSVVPFDREINKSISFRAFAIDEKNPLLNSSVDVTIEIEDENDCSPTFESNSYFFKIKEGHTGWIGKVVAHDNDSNSNGQISYGLTGFVRNNLWIVRKDGNIFSERGQSLDREVQNLHHLTIEARDRGSPPRSSSVMVQIQLEDINDNPPKFVQPSDSRYTININEVIVPGSLITKVTATDEDENENGRVTYSLLSNNYFIIDEKSGEIYINKTIERLAYLPRRLIVIAKDSGTHRLSSTLYLSVTFQQDSEERENVVTNLNQDTSYKDSRKKSFVDENNSFRWNSKEVLISLTVGSVVLIVCCAGFLLLYIWYQSRPLPSTNNTNEMDETVAGMATSPPNHKFGTSSCIQWFCLSIEKKPERPLLGSASNLSRQQQKQREVSQPLCDEQMQQVREGRNNIEDLEPNMNTNSPMMFRYQRQMMDMKHSSDSLDSSTFNKPTAHFTNIYEPPLKSHKQRCNQNYSTMQLPSYNTVQSGQTMQAYSNTKYESPFGHIEQQNVIPSKNGYFIPNFAIPNPRINNSFV